VKLVSENLHHRPVEKSKAPGANPALPEWGDRKIEIRPQMPPSGIALSRVPQPVADCYSFSYAFDGKKTPNHLDRMPLLEEICYPGR